MDQPFDIDGWAAKKLRELMEALRLRALTELQRRHMESTQWLRP